MRQTAKLSTGPINAAACRSKIDYDGHGGGPEFVVRSAAWRCACRTSQEDLRLLDRRFRVLAVTTIDRAGKAELARLVSELAVVHGKVTLSSGAIADYYIDLRRATLHHAAAPLIGTLLRQLTADWDYVAAGGLTLGADPVAGAMLHAAAANGEVLDAFVVRKAAKDHGMQRRIEGIEVSGQRVLAV